MDLAEITVFVHVVQAGSFTEAARRLGLPKSTVSRRVSRLEDTLSVRLLQRTTRTLSLTDAGRSFYERVARAIADIDEAAHAATEAQDEPRGELRLTAPVDFGIVYLAELVREFCERYPEVSVDAELTGRTVDLVAEGFDLALRAGELADSSLVARKVGELDHKLYASPDYLKRRGTPKHAQQLSSHECVLFRRQSGKAHRWHLNGPGGPVEVPVSGHISANDLYYLRSAAVAGAGIVLLPAFIGAPDLRSGRLVPVLEELSGGGSSLHVVYPSSRHLSAKVRAMSAFLIEKFSSEPWAAGHAKRRGTRR